VRSTRTSAKLDFPLPGTPATSTIGVDPLFISSDQDPFLTLKNEEEEEEEGEEEEEEEEEEDDDKEDKASEFKRKSHARHDWT
jgi:hypothetical protein